MAPNSELGHATKGRDGDEIPVVGRVSVGRDMTTAITVAGPGHLVKSSGGRAPRAVRGCFRRFKTRAP